MSNRINLLVRQCTENHCNTKCQKIVALTQDFIETKMKGALSMKRIEEIEQLQAEIDHRHQVEDEAVRLISECRFEEAVKILKTI